MKTFKELVLEAYPTAILMRDTHNWGRSDAAVKPYVILYDLPKDAKFEYRDGVYEADYMAIFPQISVRSIGEFQAAPEVAWEEAWISIQEKLIRALEL